MERSTTKSGIINQLNYLLLLIRLDYSFADIYTYFKLYAPFGVAIKDTQEMQTLVKQEYILSIYSHIAVRCAMLIYSFQLWHIFRTSHPRCGRTFN